MTHLKCLRLLSLLLPLRLLSLLSSRRLDSLVNELTTCKTFLYTFFYLQTQNKAVRPCGEFKTKSGRRRAKLEKSGTTMYIILEGANQNKPRPRVDREQETLATKDTHMSLLRCSAVRHADAEGTAVKVGIVEVVDCILFAFFIVQLAGAESLQAILYATSSKLVKF